MAGKQAKVLGDDQFRQLLAYASRGRHSVRNRVMALLSVKTVFNAGRKKLDRQAAGASLHYAGRAGE